MTHKTKLFTLMVLAIFASLSVTGQQPAHAGSGKRPGEIVEQLWKLSTEGVFLTPEGWDRYAGFFLHPGAAPADRTIRVVSNDWGVYPVSPRDSKAEVTVGCTDIGEIDAHLRYSPPAKTDFLKTAWLFHLVLAPSRSINEEPRNEVRTGALEWQIADPPGPLFTTVNTAIRYVLEARQKTNDPVIKKNADQTIEKLLKLH